MTQASTLFGINILTKKTEVAQLSAVYKCMSVLMTSHQKQLLLS